MTPSRPGTFLGRTPFLGGVFFLVLGVFLFCQDSWIRQYYMARYGQTEPYYNPPVRPYGVHLLVRNDRYGKGYFGASRNGSRLHEGIDLAAPIGSAVMASKSGRVAVARDDGNGYGNYVVLLHPDGLSTRYAHLQKLCVREGEWLAQGQLVGQCGKTGNASIRNMMPHLHFEIRDGRKALNPADRHYLNPAFPIE